MPPYTSTLSAPKPLKRHTPCYSRPFSLLQVSHIYSSTSVPLLYPGQSPLLILVNHSSSSTSIILVSPYQSFFVIQVSRSRLSKTVSRIMPESVILTSPSRPFLPTQVSHCYLSKSTILTIRVSHSYLWHSVILIYPSQSFLLPHVDRPSYPRQSFLYVQVAHPSLSNSGAPLYPSHALLRIQTIRSYFSSLIILILPKSVALISPSPSSVLTQVSPSSLSTTVTLLYLLITPDYLSPPFSSIQVSLSCPSESVPFIQVSHSLRTQICHSTLSRQAFLLV